MFSQPKTISRIVFLCGVAVMVSVIGARYWRDGSFWIDEASVALSVYDLDIDGFFFSLKGNQNFPRLYFLLIRAWRDIFGYETAVLRFFPVVFSVSATILALWILRIRFARAPLILLLAILLDMIPTSWFVYAVFLKHYSFDVFLALIPFCLGDAFYDDVLRHGRGRWRIGLLCLPIAVSYSYVIPLLGRLGGAYAQGFASRRFALDARAVSVLVLGVATFLGVIWATDLRFTAALDLTADAHAGSALGTDWSRTGIILRRLAVGWYTGSSEFQSGIGLPGFVLRALEACALVGVARIAWDGLLRGRASPEAPRAWGSRSLGALVAVVGLLIASLLTGYPVTEGRLTLFVLIFVQILIFEGVSWIVVQLDAATRGLRLPVSIGTLICVLLLAAFAGPAVRNGSAMAFGDTPSNIRGVLPEIARHRDRTVLVTACSRKQVETLPEGLGAAAVLQLPLLIDPEKDLPLGERVLLLNVHDSRPCWHTVDRLVRMSTRAEELSRDGNTVGLWLLELPEVVPEWAKVGRSRGAGPRETRPTRRRGPS